MKQISTICLPLVLFSVMSVIAQTMPQTPTPSPELKKQDFFAGKWTLEGKTIASSFGPGGQAFRSTESLEWMPGGFFLLAHSYSEGKLAELTIIGYDSEEKVFTHTSYDSASGKIERWRGTAGDDTWSWTRDTTIKGRPGQVRLTIRKTSPRSYSFVEDVKSSEARDWSAVAEGTGTKTE